MPGIQATVKNAIIGLIKDLVGGLAGIIDFLFQIAKNYLTSTPYPDNLYSFNPPTKGLWPKLYHNLYDELVIVLLPTLFGLALGLAMFFNIFSEKQKRVSIRRAVFAYPLALSWWWFGGWFLKFTNDLAGLIVADAAVKGSLGTNLGSSLGAIAVSVLIYIFGATIILVIIGIYLLRQLAIYAYMAAMPILLMFWIVPIQPVSGWAKSMMGKFVPLVLMTLPTAFLLRVGSLFLGEGAAAAATSSGGLSTQLVSTILGLATIAGAGLVPKYVFSFSSQVSNAVGSGTRVGRGMYRGARASGASSAAGGERSRAASGTAGRAGGRRSGSSSETSDEHKHDPKTDFSSQRRMRSQRRRRRERAKKAGAGARKAAGGSKRLAKGTVKGAAKGGIYGWRGTKGAAKKTKSGAIRAADTVARNRHAEGSTARGIAGDAKDATVSGAHSAAEGMHRYRMRAQENMALRSEQLRERYWSNDDDGDTERQASIEEYDDGNGKPPGFEDPAQTDLEEYQ
ncbi:hypothetical protein ABSL23_15760 (plasmid) [Halobacterium sp. NMX12-1]|uniref:Type IV secretion system protein n=1 Tax=Halobacterium sp. NMX12-1 TaxID=3166650 RepID=A0AAU8CJ91_9EURY